jgi:hypothetical protein
VPLTESLVNDLVFAAIAVVFLWAFPERLERRDLLRLLHRLRSLAHVIDMHQLSKDPSRRARATRRPHKASCTAWMPTSYTATSTTARKC